MRPRALITGIASQDGCYLSELLLSRGYEVHGIVHPVALDRASPDLFLMEPVIDDIILHEATFRNSSRVPSLLSAIKPNHCYHLAATGPASDSTEDEFSSLQLNLSTTHCLLASLHSFVPECRFYISASSEVFGAADETPQRETTRFLPNSLAGVRTVAEFHLVANYRDAHHMHASAGILYCHESPRQTIASIARKITSKLVEILKGESGSLNLDDLDARYDWGHARDYVRAMLLMMEHPCPGDYVIATGETHTVREFAEAAFTLAGLDYRDYVNTNAQLSSHSLKAHLVGNSTRAQSILGWQPTVTFHEMVVEMVEAECQSHNLRIPSPTVAIRRNKAPAASPKRERIPVASPRIGKKEIAFVQDAVASGWVSSIGPYIGRLEETFASFVGCSDAVAVSNGTAALHLGLHVLGLGPGDEVLVPDLTFVAPVHAIMQTGATPVFVDSDVETWGIDPIAAERAITPATRAIVVVHLYGRPAAMDALINLARRYNLLLIEDAAEAHGAAIDGKRTGSFGDLATFSFYGNKIVTTGEGGMITTNDAQLVPRLQLLRDHGMCANRRYFHLEPAFNYRMTNIQAALGVAQMQQIDDFLARRRRIHGWYSEHLGDDPRFLLCTEKPGITNSYWMHCLVLRPEYGLCRDTLMRDLSAADIDTRPFFLPMHAMPHLQAFRVVGRNDSSCPVAEWLSAYGLNLPSSSELTAASVDYISRNILASLSSQSAATESSVPSESSSARCID